MTTDNTDVDTELDPDLDALDSAADAPEPNQEDNEAAEQLAAAQAETEARARRIGYVPESEWRGEPPKHGFMSADEYIKRGEQILPVMAARNRNLDSQLTEAQARIKELEVQAKEATKRVSEATQAFQEFRKFNENAYKRGYEERERELMSVRDEAVRSADPDAFNRADAELTELRNRKPAVEPEPPPKPEPEPAPITPQVDPIVTKWGDDNSWFKTDPLLNNYATVYHGQLLQEKPELSLADNLKEVTAEVKRRFPDKFQNERRNGAASVALPNGSHRPPPKKGRTFEDLPREAKDAYHRFAKLDPKFTKEQYVTDYQWD
jgi:hypothetical protein